MEAKAKVPFGGWMSNCFRIKVLSSATRARDLVFILDLMPVAKISKGKCCKHLEKEGLANFQRWYCRSSFFFLSQ